MLSLPIACLQLPTGCSKDHIDRHISNDMYQYDNTNDNKEQKLNNHAATAEAPCHPQPPSAPPSTGLHGKLDASVDVSWLNPATRPASHADAVQAASSKDTPHVRLDLRNLRAAFAKPVPVVQPVEGSAWPMDSDEPPPFPPPWPSTADRRAMQRESASSHPEAPLGPLAAAWEAKLQEWYGKLQTHFNFDPADLPANLRHNVHKWEKRLQYLLPDEHELYDSVIASIRLGHRIPFGDCEPEKFFRRRNPPSLALDKDRAWLAVKKDMAHGALEPVNLARDCIPTCVCPVRTADKKDGTARFVHNSRRVNKCVPKAASACELESLLRTRNMLIPGGFLVGLDFASGYHCIAMQKDHRRFLAFALDIDEIPAHAAEWLFANFPDAFLASKNCFVFRYTALPFGLSSSCKTFNDVITALMGFWRRCPSGEGSTRASSYIDDVMAVANSFDVVRVMTIHAITQSNACPCVRRLCAHQFEWCSRPRAWACPSRSQSALLSPTGECHGDACSLCGACHGGACFLCGVCHGGACFLCGACHDGACFLCGACHGDA